MRLWRRASAASEAEKRKSKHFGTRRDYPSDVVGVTIIRIKSETANTTPV